jgi:hypothetical protein
MVLSTGTTSGRVIRFSPKSAVNSVEGLSRALRCFCWRIEVSRKYSLYESPIQQSRDLIKSGSIPALLSMTMAQTLPEWELKCINTSLIKCGWHAFATDWSTSDILLPVRYLTMPCLFANTPMGWVSDWPSLLARRRILLGAVLIKF